MELRLRVLDQEGSELQIEEDKNKKCNAEFSSVNDKILHKDIKKCKDAESESAKGKQARKAVRRNADCAAAARRS